MKNFTLVGVEKTLLRVAVKADTSEQALAQSGESDFWSDADEEALGVDEVYVEGEPNGDEEALFCVVYTHEHGTDVWVAKSETIAYQSAAATIFRWLGQEEWDDKSCVAALKAGDWQEAVDEFNSNHPSERIEVTAINGGKVEREDRHASLLAEITQWALERNDDQDPDEEDPS